jgi:hypothetical protein
MNIVMPYFIDFLKFFAAFVLIIGAALLTLHYFMAGVF